MVYLIQHTFIEYLKNILPKIQRIVYLSDRLAAQYKNKKNMYNLCLHKKEFGLDAIGISLLHITTNHHVIVQEEL